MSEHDGGTLVAAFDGIGSLRDPLDRAQVEMALRAYVPDSRVSAVDSHDWNADPHSRGAWLAWPPGWAAWASQLGAHEGRLAFAGSDLAIEGGGYMEGAIATGHEAAAHVAQIVSPQATPAAG